METLILNDFRFCKSEFHPIFHFSKSEYRLSTNSATPSYMTLHRDYFTFSVNVHTFDQLLRGHPVSNIEVGR